MIRSAFLLYFIIGLINASYAQYVSGYIVYSDGTKIECDISKNDLYDNAKNSFRYKLKSDAKILKATVENTSEIGIPGAIKIVSEIVQLDNQDDRTDKLKKVPELIFDKKKVFLKTIIDGRLSLLMYRVMNQTRFYIQKENELILLKYYKYLKYRNVAEYREYSTQLWSMVGCSGWTIGEVSALDYNKKDISKYVNDINSCSGNSSTTFESTTIATKERFRFSIYGSIGQHSYGLEKISQPGIDDFNLDTKITSEFGVEVEFFADPLGEKFAIVFAPFFSAYSNERDLTYTTWEVVNGVDRLVTTGFPESEIKSVSSLALPLGLRYYLNSSSNISPFLESFVVLADFYNGEIGLDIEDSPYEDLKRYNSFVFGAGVGIFNRGFVHVRHRMIGDNFVSFTGTKILESRNSVAIRFAF